MTIEEAIKHCKEVAELNRNQWKNCPAEKDTREHLTCEQCAEEHEQLAEWLEELVELRKTPRPQGEWIPVSERLPEVGVQVLCSNEYGSVFTSAITAIHESGRPKFGKHYSVIAWQPLPEPYENGGAE